MILPLHTLGKEPQTIELEADSADFEEFSDSGMKGKVGVRLEVTPMAGDSYLVQGRATGSMDAECARCVEPFTQPFSVDFNLLMDRKDSVGTEWVEDEDQGVEDYQVRLGPDVTEVSLHSMIAEQVILNYNSQPLPELDAAGRCVQCGRPAPVAPEPKQDKAPDPRWEKLAGLKNGSVPRDGDKAR